MALTVNRKLNLVVPVYDDKNNVAYYVHSTPIASEIYDVYYRVISEVFSEIISHGNVYSISSGPKVAKMLLRDRAVATGRWAGANGVESGLFGEIRRLTNVVIPDAKGGWTTMGFEDAMNGDLMDKDDIEEVENLLCFFIVLSAMQRKKDPVIQSTLEAVSNLLDAQLTSSNSTEFVASLRISTATENTGAKPTPSPIPV